MKRLLIAVLPAVLAVAAGCGTVHGAAATGAQGSGSSPAQGVSSGQPLSPTPTPVARKRWLPHLSARQVATGHLVPRHWTMLRLTQGGTIAEIRYRMGGCLPPPKGVLVTQSGSAVTLSLEAPQLKLAADCAPVGGIQTALVHIPALGNRALRHVPPSD